MAQRNIVLVGGGHAHAQVIKALNHAALPPGMCVTLIDPLESASYSGMVPGAVSQMYTPDQTKIHLKPLAAWAGIKFIQGRLLSINTAEKQIKVDHNSGETETLCYDVISLDIGSRTAHTEHVPGVSEHCIATRPIHLLVGALKEKREMLLSKGLEEVHCVVAGSGAAGIELAFAVDTLFSEKFESVRVTMVDSQSTLMPHDTEMGRTYIVREVERRGIACEHGCHVEKVTADTVFLDNGKALQHDVALWATGAASHDCAAQFPEGGVETIPGGWISVNTHMQSTSCEDVFAAGDCCHISTVESSPPKAGVYAVRTGPILIHNLLAKLNGEPLIEYLPQDDFLRLFNCSDGTAIGLRFGVAFQGEWVWHVKDTIDQNFMNLFKEENLPPLNKEATSETEQFDAKQNAAFSVAETPSEAAALLASHGPDIKPWDVIKRMGLDEEFRQQVVEIMVKDFEENKAA